MRYSGIDGEEMAFHAKQLRFILLTLGCFALAALFFIFKKSNHEQYFLKFNTKNRFPAEGKRVINDFRMLKDFFDANTFGGLVNYDLNIKVYSHKEVFSRKFQDILIEKVSNKTKIKQMAPQKYGDYLSEPFLNSFKEVYKEYGLDGVPLQAHFEFKPTLAKGLSFHKEMSNNNIIDYSNKQQLGQFLNEKAPSLIESIDKNKLPSNGNTYQYIGGLITIKTKGGHVFSQKKNDLFDGSIHYKRFFRLNRPQDLNLFIENKDLNIHMVHFKSREFGMPPYITTDLIKKFNLKNNPAILQKLIINFGSLAPRNFFFDDERKSLLPENVRERKIINSRLYLKGDTSKSSFKAEVHSLVWSFENESFTDESRITIKLIRPKGSIDYGTEKNHIRNQIIMKYAPDLIKGLRLLRFHENLGFRQIR